MTESSNEPASDQSTFPPRWLPIGLLIAVAVLGLAWMGIGIWHDTPPAEDSTEVIFARDMMAHHEQAVNMAVILHDRTQDAELRQLTLDIILTQQAQIGQMYGWLSVWGLPISGRRAPMESHLGRMGMATQREVNALHTLPIEAAELSFLQLMTRHHQGGMAMAQEALVLPLRPEVRRAAQATVDSQQSEIEYMQQLLAEREATWANMSVTSSATPTQ